MTNGQIKRQFRRKKTVGYRVIWDAPIIDGHRPGKRFQTRHEAEAALAASGKPGHVSRIKVNHNGTMWHEPVLRVAD